MKRKQFSIRSLFIATAAAAVIVLVPARSFHATRDFDAFIAHVEERGGFVLFSYQLDDDGAYLPWAKMGWLKRIGIQTRQPHREKPVGRPPLGGVLILSGRRHGQCEQH